MKSSEWFARLASDPFRAALLLILLAGLIVALWHISSVRNQNRYQMQLSATPGGVVYVLDQKEGVLYFARQNEIVDGWTNIWRKAPALPTERQKHGKEAIPSRDRMINNAMSADEED
jgi:hypothetical protein